MPYIMGGGILTGFIGNDQNSLRLGGVCFGAGIDFRLGKFLILGVNYTGGYQEYLGMWYNGVSGSDQDLDMSMFNHSFGVSIMFTFQKLSAHVYKDLMEHIDSR